MMDRYYRQVWVCLLPQASIFTGDNFGVIHVGDVYGYFIWDDNV